MTIEEMLALDPGRELDAHIAVMVMGFKEVTIVGNHYFTDPIDTSLKEYSTDIAAAWEIVSKLKDKFDVSVYTDQNGMYAAEINFYVVDDCETAQEAICKAALLAVLGEEEA